MMAIDQNVFYIVIAVIVVVGLIVALMQWRKVREAQTNVEFLTKQAELKKIELVERDLESKRMMNDIILPKDQQEKLTNIRENTSSLMNKAGYLHGEINERVNRLESKTEYIKLQKLLMDIEEKEKELENKFKEGKK
jgi:predicted mannosyl-3-phosphoglycerate phosphatase (HAD superfamily)